MKYQIERTIEEEEGGREEGGDEDQVFIIGGGIGGLGMRWPGEAKEVI